MTGARLQRKSPLIPTLPISVTSLVVALFSLSVGRKVPSSFFLVGRVDYSSVGERCCPPFVSREKSSSLVIAGFIPFFLIPFADRPASHFTRRTTIFFFFSHPDEEMALCLSFLIKRGKFLTAGRRFVADFKFRRFFEGEWVFFC